MKRLNYSMNLINKIYSKVDMTLLPRALRRLKLIQSYNRRAVKLSYPPEYLQIDVCAFCNLKCRMCPQGIEGGMAKKGEMDYSLYKKIIDSGAKAGIFSVILALSGEPLMHKNIIEMIRYAKDKGFRVIMSTNCTLLNDSLSSELIKSGLDEIILSFDTMNKEDYENYRLGAKFEVVLNRIFSFLKMRKKLKALKPFPTMQNLQKFKPNILQPKIEKDFWETFGSLNVWIIPKYLTNWAGIMGKDNIYEETRISRKNTDYRQCYTIYQRLVVSWDGLVLSCCNDFQRRQVVGDLTKQNVFEVWNSPVYMDIRHKLAKGEYKKLPLCRDCGALWK